jgi:hypothetical protein
VVVPWRRTTRTGDRFYESEHSGDEMVNEKFEAYKQLISDSDAVMVSAEKARLGGDVRGAKMLSDKGTLMQETASQMFNPAPKKPKG